MAHSIGKTIAELRKAKGWTQIELAEKLNVSDKAVSKWESEGGFPEITQFPVLAKIFDVSIDYLMTGKETEPEIITMSKIELCAKNDDVSMVKDINLTTKDEKGKTFIDYIVEYESCKVFSAICNDNRFLLLIGANGGSIKTFDIVTLIKFALITNNTSILDKKFVLGPHCSVNDVKALFHKEDSKNIIGTAKVACIITDELLDIIVQDKRVSPDTILYLLDKQKGHDCVWYRVLPYLLHQSYLHNNIELFNMVLNAAKANNKGAFEKWAIVVDGWYGPNYNLGYFAVSNKGNANYYYGVVRALEKTIKLALDRSDIETVEKLNALNNSVMKYNAGFKCYIATADEIRIAKLKMDKSISESEIKIQSTIHEGVVCIDELLTLNDFKIIKKVLNEYPIHIVELLDEWLSKSKWKELYHFAIDNNNENLANAIIEKDGTEYIKRAIQEYFKKDKYNFNKKHFYLYENSRQKSIASPDKEQFNKIKQRIIDELALKIDKDTTVGNLTKEYFEGELAKGNIDMVVVKLCVRLEAILKCDYHYDGELSAMLEKYCQEHGWEDDGWGYSVESECVKYLQKLRMKRNNIVHSEKNNVDLTIEELKYCIDYICKMG